MTISRRKVLQAASLASIGAATAATLASASFRGAPAQQNPSA